MDRKKTFNLSFQISEAAQKFMVGEYRRLRQRDCVSGTKSSFRITVRQLESMIRLSEAMARLYIADHVDPTHVKEAFRLLSKVNKSLIIEQNCQQNVPAIYFPPPNFV